MNRQPPENPNNLFIAILLSMGVMLAWQIFYAGPKLKEEQARIEREKQTKGTPQVAVPGSTPTAGTTAAPGAATTPGGAPPAATGGAPAAPATAPAGAMTREAALALSPRVAIDTPSLKGSVSLKGGRIDDIQLAKYRETTKPGAALVTLYSPAEAPNAYFAEHGFVAQPGAQVKLPDRDTPWRQEGSGALTAAQPLKLVWDNGQGLVFRRTISVDQDYMFKIADEVENKSQADVTLYPYARIYRYGTPKIEGFFIQHEGLIGVVGDAGLQEHTYSDVQKQDGSKRFEGKKGGWLGFTDKYWASALIPDQNETYSASLKLASPRSETAKEAFQADYMRTAVTIPAGATKGVSTNLYAGAKQVQLIQGYADKLGIKQFDLMTDWGWFYFITKPLYYLLDWLYKLLGNFGLAILATTVLVKLAFFPLANKSYESMAKMKKLQPEMERIRDRFKDDKARQQQELMQLYQKEKINPLAGCLPILLQIPVFFALYKVLFVSIDMRHAPFYGWIKDLSAPDPTSIFNLFGLLPFAVPDFLMVGVWPLIMGATMWLQMQLNPPQPDPTQQMIFNWMPVMFTFLLASFPAGLVIYWAWNNVLSLIQQAYIMRKQGVEVHLMDNIKGTLAPVMSVFRRKDATKPTAKS